MPSRIPRISTLAAAGLIFCAGGAAAQTVFLEDFGPGVVGAATRLASPYVPSTPIGTVTDYFKFAEYTPGNPANGTPEYRSNRIDDGYYAVLPPNNLEAADAGTFWYNPNNPNREGPIVSDHTTLAAATHNGNALVVNAGLVLNYFYRRDFQPVAGASYRISAWRYVVRTKDNYASGNRSSLKFEIQQINSTNVINSSPNFESVVGGPTSDPPSDISQWRQLSYEFRIPDNCFGDQDPAPFAIGLRNVLPLIGGNDLLLDDIQLERIGSTSTNTITCPDSIERPYTVTAVDDSFGTVAQGSTTSINPLVNDRVNDDGMVDGTVGVGKLLDPTTLKIMTPPAHGTVTVNPTTGAITYVAAANYAGTDRFEYKICNDAPTPPACDTAWVTVTINAPVVAPVPTLSQWALAALLGMLALLGWRTLRRSV